MESSCTHSSLPSKRLSVCICTWNRAQSLARTLQSIVDADKPAGLDWEVIVVDNNSTDKTADIIQSFTGLLPILGIFEKTPGLSHARNAAVQAARGTYLLWTDDDVVVGRHWITAYLAAFDRFPQAVVFGGPIRAVFDGTIPTWLEQGWRSAPLPFCQNDLGPESIPLTLTPLKLPYGANFALRRIEQSAFLYDPTLGASPNNRLLGEETTVMADILKTGASGYWVPDAAVQHINGQDRMSLAYIKNYYMKSGRTKVAFSAADTGPLYFGRPRWAWRLIIESTFEYCWARLRGDPGVWLGKFASLAMARGIFEEYGRRKEGALVYA